MKKFEDAVRDLKKPVEYVEPITPGYEHRAENILKLAAEERARRLDMMLAEEILAAINDVYVKYGYFGTKLTVEDVTLMIRLLLEEKQRRRAEEDLKRVEERRKEETDESERVR